MSGTEEPALDLPDAAGHVGRKKSPLVRRVPVSGPEGLLTLALLVPWGLWVLAGDPSVALPLLALVLASGGLGLLLRRLPSPLPSISALPAGLVWTAGVLLLPAAAAGLACALVAGTVLLLYVTLPNPGELPVPFAIVGAQVSLPAMGGALSLVVALTLLGVSAPLFAVVLLPTLGALVLLVYLFVRIGSAGA
jgi:hypothetical protein